MSLGNMATFAAHPSHSSTVVTYILTSNTETEYKHAVGTYSRWRSQFK